MFGFRSHKAIQSAPCSPKSCKRFTKHIRKRPSTFTDGISNTIKRASRRISSNKLEIPAELCPSCVEYVLDRSESPTPDVSLITSLSLIFDGLCPHQELHVAEILSTMGGLHRLELLAVQTTPCFYAVLAERAQFQLEYFACESPLFDTLLRFLSSQRRLLEFTYLTQSLEPQTLISHPHDGGILHTVQTLSTTVPLLSHPQLDPTSLRRLEYIGGGHSLKEEVRAIEKIYRLGPQLRSLRFTWGAGRAEAFLDVTKFFCIAANTSLIEYVYLSEVSQNVSEISSDTLTTHSLRVKIGFRYSSSSSKLVLGTRPGRNCTLLFGFQIRLTRTTSTNPNLPYHPRHSLHLISSSCWAQSRKATLSDREDNPPPPLGTQPPPSSPPIPPDPPWPRPPRHAAHAHHRSRISTASI